MNLVHLFGTRFQKGGLLLYFWPFWCCKTHLPFSLELMVRQSQSGFSDRNKIYHGSILRRKLSRTWRIKATPEHHTTTTMFNRHTMFFFLKCCGMFMLNETGHIKAPCLFCRCYLKQKNTNVWSNFGRSVTYRKPTSCCQTCSARVAVIGSLEMEGSIQNIDNNNTKSVSVSDRQ